MARPPHPNNWRSPWPWHRWLGVGAAIVMLWVAATGVLLVHADRLGLARQPVESAWLLDLFGVPTPELGIAFETSAGWIVQVGDGAQLDASPLPEALGALVGVERAADGALRVQGEQAQALLTGTGELIEVLPPDADPALGALTPLARAVPPPALAEKFVAAGRSRLLDREQVLRMLHGSHGTGVLGTFIADLTALALVVLTLTGLQMHRQKRARERAQAAAAREG